MRAGDPNCPRGGNTLTAESDASYDEQVAAIRDTAAQLHDAAGGDRAVVWTHGNGPQVGNRLLERAAAEKPFETAAGATDCPVYFGRSR